MLFALTTSLTTHTFANSSVTSLFAKDTGMTTSSIRVSREAPRMMVMLVPVARREVQVGGKVVQDNKDHHASDRM